jgi:hypothetical protein
MISWDLIEDGSINEDHPAHPTSPIMGGAPPNRGQGQQATNAHSRRAGVPTTPKRRTEQLGIPHQGQHLPPTSLAAGISTSKHKATSTHGMQQQALRARRIYPPLVWPNSGGEQYSRLDRLPGGDGILEPHRPPPLQNLLSQLSRR